jgi:POT family proton-dependent oligopeptide transporter
MPGQPDQKGFFGHPRGLATLFFTEMWERFAYYGMRALLILFMTAATDHVVLGADGGILRSNPGLGYDIGMAAAIYGLYTSLVYILTLPGGWIADNLWGQRKAVFVGGCFIAAGQLSMVLPNTFTFFFGLVLVIFGTGLLKPNVSTVVGELYPEGGARRDAGFSIFYMGINLGAWLGPLVTGFFGEQYNWHWGFGVGAIGMILGLIQYKAGDKYLGECGYLKPDAAAKNVASMSRNFFTGFFAVMAGIVGFGYLVSIGTIPVTLTQIATYMGYGVLILVAAYFVYLWMFGGHTAEENKRLGVIFWLFLIVRVAGTCVVLPVGQPGLHHSARAGVRFALALAGQGEGKPVASPQGGARLVGLVPGFLRHRLGRGQRQRRDSGDGGLAHRDLLSAHMR